jgi:ribosomal protein S18 acetylase RimI-like enzyme
MVEIFEITQITAEVMDAYAHLIPQLSEYAQPPDRVLLEEMAASQATILLAARDPHSGNQIVGLLALVVFRVPTGKHAWIEDVVVDAPARGKGIGEALVRAALDRARQMGAKSVDLTSRPAREAANRLYLRLGFQPRHTNLYRYLLD